jgi:hypothetical protein
MDGVLPQGLKLIEMIRAGGGEILKDWFSEDPRSPAIRLEAGGEVFYTPFGALLPPDYLEHSSESYGQIAVQVDDGDTSDSVLIVEFRAGV